MFSFFKSNADVQADIDNNATKSKEDILGAAASAPSPPSSAPAASATAPPSSAPAASATAPPSSAPAASATAPPPVASATAPPPSLDLQTSSTPPRNVQSSNAPSGLRNPPQPASRLSSDDTTGLVTSQRNTDLRTSAQVNPLIVDKRRNEIVSSGPAENVQSTPVGDIQDIMSPEDLIKKKPSKNYNWLWEKQSSETINEVPKTTPNSETTGTPLMNQILNFAGILVLIALFVLLCLIIYNMSSSSVFENKNIISIPEKKPDTVVNNINVPDMKPPIINMPDIKMPEQKECPACPKCPDTICPKNPSIGELVDAIFPGRGYSFGADGGFPRNTFDNSFDPSQWGYSEAPLQMSNIPDKVIEQKSYDELYDTQFNNMENLTKKIEAIKAKAGFNLVDLRDEPEPKDQPKMVDNTISEPAQDRADNIRDILNDS
jgi:hypothetical protein